MSDVGSPAYVCTVGGSAEPIVSALRQNHPLSFVYFLCSTGPAGSDRTIEEPTAQARRSKCPSCGKTSEEVTHEEAIVARAQLGAGTYSVERVSDPDDLSAVLEACKRIEEDLAARGLGPRVVANYTGGTKTMSLGLGYHAIQAGWEVQVSSGTRKDLIKVTMGERALRQDLSAIVTQRALESARQLFERHDFEGTTSVLEDLYARHSVPKELRPTCDELLERARMWTAIDRFDLASAAKLAELGDDREKLTGLRRGLRALSLFDDPSTTWSPKDVDGLGLLEDLLTNADRCAQRGHYDDAFARLYRATELSAQLRLRRTHNVVTGDVDLSNPRLPDSSKPWLDSRRRDAKSPILIALFDAFRLLDELADPLGAYFMAHKEELLGFLEVRNRSWLAHGVVPVTPEKWRETGPGWFRWLEGAKALVAAS
ncbi:MAG: TIGR02710 family CRISPR-associated protein [Deltaproteobacteria bacterium]|nr:TIGR02710 family CRISPR-associated protein [Deltaproteobacteria bacterium]